MRIAICQFHSGTDKERNLATIAGLAAEAEASGAKLALFPELAMYDEPTLGLSAVEHAEALDGPFVTGLATIARRTGLFLVAGMTERIDGERAYNTAVVVSPSDGLTARYRKAHLYDAFGYRESDTIRPGELEGPVTFEVDGVTVGVLTCYDLRFPEAARQHADAGTDLLLYPSAWMPGARKEDHWSTLLRARAIENTVFVAGVSQSPPDIGIGGSLIADPMGVTMAELGEHPGVATADVHHARIADVRAKNPSLANRRFAVVPLDSHTTKEEEHV
ncbi:carbon-nitrogen hydrolase family protein [Microbacterium halotolerans]|uniref:carbon-nitrogen hydrolase family protein n=1 Tax=Microbacterium halotolerans TaxID=246613 RepID=UPI000E6AA8E4|nr:carbon-nitrogen hydrolase family protein [Microbacterium halotolerans]